MDLHSAGASLTLRLGSAKAVWAGNCVPLSPSTTTSSQSCSTGRCPHHKVPLPAARSSSCAPDSTTSAQTWSCCRLTQALLFSSGHLTSSFPHVSMHTNTYPHPLLHVNSLSPLTAEKPIPAWTKPVHLSQDILGCFSMGEKLPASWALWTLSGPGLCTGSRRALQRL